MSAARTVPYRGYIELLLLANAPMEQIRQAFTRRGMPEPAPDFVLGLRRELWSKLTLETRKFYDSKAEMLDVRSLPADVAENLRQAGFPEIFDLSASLTEARRWFDSSDLRACYYVHVLGSRTEPDLIEAMGSLLKAPVNVDTVRVFRKYFCNPDHLTPMDWREWIADLRDYLRQEADIYGVCYSNRVPFSFVRWKVNAALGKHDLDEMVEHVASYSYHKGLELSEGSPDESFEMTQSWFGQFMRAYTLHKTIGRGKTASSEDAVQDALFKLVQVRDKPRHVSELEHVTKTEPSRPASITRPNTKDSD